MERKPSQLSGGQRQRGALARAVIAEHPLCLMDEPVSNLDAKLRQEMRNEIRALRPELGMTVLYVTQDQVEAMSMADRVLLLNQGRIGQDDSPDVLYDKPTTLFARELEDAARIEGCGTMGVLLRVYVPVARPVYLAYGLVSVSTHWNNFLWSLVVTSSVETRPLIVGLAVFGVPKSGVNRSIISASTLLEVAPLLAAFLLFQWQFVQSFMTAGIR